MWSKYKIEVESRRVRQRSIAWRTAFQPCSWGLPTQNYLQLKLRPGMRQLHPPGLEGIYSLDRRSKAKDRHVWYRSTSSLQSASRSDFRSLIIKLGCSISVKVKQQDRALPKPRFGDCTSYSASNVALYGGVIGNLITRGFFYPAINIKRLSSINSKVDFGVVKRLHRSALVVCKSAAHRCCSALSLDDRDRRSAGLDAEGARPVGVFADNVDVRLNAPGFQVRRRYRASLRLHKGIGGISTKHCKVLPNACQKLQARRYGSKA